MKSWRKVWREVIVTSLSNHGLMALRDALTTDDKRLIQGATTCPPPLMYNASWPVEAADAIGLCFWLGNGLKTIGEIEHSFAQTCQNCDRLMGEQSTSRYFLGWYDDTPRETVRTELLKEVNDVLYQRYQEDYAAEMAYDNFQAEQAELAVLEGRVEHIGTTDEF